MGAPGPGSPRTGLCSRGGGLDSETWERTTPSPTKATVHGLGWRHAPCMNAVNSLVYPTHARRAALRRAPARTAIAGLRAAPAPRGDEAGARGIQIPADG